MTRIAESKNFHPDLRRLSLFLPRRPFTERTLPLMRRLQTLIPVREGVDVESVTEAVNVRILRPANSSRDSGAALLWIHGGGYVTGSAAQEDRLCQRFADAVGITVVSVDYRLAPEFPYPTSLEDCYCALEWLTHQPGVDPGRIAIGGSSAGAGLAAALAQLAYDRGRMSPVLQLLAYPMLDDRTEIVDRHHRLWNARSNRCGWSSYLGSADRATAVPSRRDDLRGLPATWIGVGTLDLFHDECLDYARRLSEAGVACHLTVVPGAFHGFDVVAPRTSVALEFFTAQCDALQAALIQHPTSPH